MREHEWTYKNTVFRATDFRGTWVCEFYHPSFSWAAVGTPDPSKTVAMKSAEQEYDSLEAADMRPLWDEDY